MPEGTPSSINAECIGLNVWAAAQPTAALQAIPAPAEGYTAAAQASGDTTAEGWPCDT